MPAIHFLGFEEPEVDELKPRILNILVREGVADIAVFVRHPGVQVNQALTMERMPFLHIGGNRPGLPELLARAINTELPELSIEYETHGFIPGRSSTVAG